MRSYYAAGCPLQQPRIRKGIGSMAEFAADIVEIGDKIANLTIIKAVELKEYLKEKYKIEPAAGGVMMAPAAGGAAVAAKPAEKTEFTVVLAGFDAAKKINVITCCRELTGMGCQPHT